MLESGVWWGNGWFWAVPLGMFALCMYVMFFSRGGAMCAGPASDTHRPPGGKRKATESPADTAKRRLASGEINQKEYQKIISALGS
ncbi:hypothetical protein MNBD_NITROSPINAE02-158 [hydrothermal vent metagenome]|uniref:SHOCT domain-containing protein n=1 Tax=hydrothermal vent metagenome TaxID=652676 RepID=A0A3B1CQR9_9ZZZZ